MKVPSPQMGLNPAIDFGATQTDVLPRLTAEFDELLGFAPLPVDAISDDRDPNLAGICGLAWAQPRIFVGQ
jgi:hypothetical protein